MVDKNVVGEFLQAIQTKNTNTDHTYNATVTQVDDQGVVWVQLNGSDKETPTASTSSEVKRGDEVNVQWRNNQLYIAGNYSNPSAGSIRVAAVEAAAQIANQAASNAVADAGVARAAAEDAKATAESVHGIAVQAEKSAESAQTSAVSALNSANMAFNHLSVVEDIVGVLDLLTKNGDYQRTTDPEPLQDKWYFTRTGSGTSADPYEYQVVNDPVFEYVLTSDTDIVQGKTYYTRTGTGTEADPYVYTQVENPVVADIGTYYEYTNWNYFELVGIDTAIQNYVSSHLALDDNSLFLQNGNGTRVELSTTNGVILYNENGNPVASYGADTIIGDLNNFGIKIGESPDSTQQNPAYELGFYQDGNRVAYINNNSLYITQTVVLKQMQMGDNLGIWAWCVHQVENKNNLYLKWLG